MQKKKSTRSGLEDMRSSGLDLRPSQNATESKYFLDTWDISLKKRSRKKYPIGREMKDGAVLIRILIFCRYSHGTTYSVTDAADYDSREPVGDIGLWEFSLDPEDEDETELDTSAVFRNFIRECEGLLVPQKYILAMEFRDGPEEIAWAKYSFEFPDALEKLKAEEE